MADYNSLWIPLIVIMIFITVSFLTIFFGRFRAFVRYEINWLFILHFVAVVFSIFLFKDHILLFINSLGDMVFEKKKLGDLLIYSNEFPYSPLNSIEIEKLSIRGNSIVTSLETTSIASFALFIPFMFSLYINFYKDIFIGLENIVKSDNQDFILSSDKDRILIEFNKLNARFKSYFLWLKVLFFLSCFSLIAVMLGIYLSYDLEQAICKIILLDFLRWINNVTILSFITLLFSYLFLIIPYYRNLHDITILTRVRP